MRVRKRRRGVAPCPSIGLRGCAGFLTTLRIFADRIGVHPTMTRPSVQCGPTPMWCERQGTLRSFWVSPPLLILKLMKGGAKSTEAISATLRQVGRCCHFDLANMRSQDLEFKLIFVLQTLKKVTKLSLMEPLTQLIDRSRIETNDTIETDRQDTKFTSIPCKSCVHSMKHTIFWRANEHAENAKWVNQNCDALVRAYNYIRQKKIPASELLNKIHLFTSKSDDIYTISRLLSP